MALIDLIPDDLNPTLEYLPQANTRRVYDRGIYSNDTPFKTPPTCVSLTGLPSRVGVAQTTIFSKPYDAKMVDPTGVDRAAAGAWYVDVIISGDTDLSPNSIYVTLSHPDWGGEETRLVPAGTAKVCWTDLAIATPPPTTNIVFVGGGGGGGGTSDYLQLVNVPATFAPSPHGHVATDISNSTATGRSLLLAIDALAARGVIGAGTSSLALGAPGTTSAALAVPGSDARLTNARTPTAHAHVSTEITDFIEAAQDAVALLLAGASGVTLSYDDAANQLTITGGGTAGLDAEAVRDTIGLAIIGSGYISVVVNDAADTITLTQSQALIDALTAKAADNAVVKLTGNQSIEGVKTFSAAPVVPVDSFAINRVTGLADNLASRGLFANSVLFVLKVGGVWPTSYDANGDPVYTGGTASTGVRPTSSTRCMVIWRGAEPFPPLVTTGVEGRYSVDELHIES